MKKSTTLQLAIIALMAALMCIAGPLSIPLPVTLVPISLTNLAIYIAAYVLGAKKTTASFIIYLLIGLAGLPVFSGLGSGFGKLLGPTGGYLIGFILTAFITGFFVEKFSDKIYMQVVGMVLGVTAAYLFGTVWFSYQQTMSFGASLAMCVYPFLIGDAIKIAIAAIIGPMIRKRLIRANLI